MNAVLVVAEAEPMPDALFMGGLRYPWWERLDEVRSRILDTVTYAEAEEALAIGQMFIQEWAQEAELHGCQPVHVLRPPSAVGLKDGGLAWRWENGMEPVEYGPGCLTLASPFTSLARTFQLGRDGYVYMTRAFVRPRAQSDFQVSGGE